MKKIIYPVLLLPFLLFTCSKDDEMKSEIETIPQSHTMELSLTSLDDESDLIIEGEGGLKSSALDFISTVSVGDTLIWQIKENGFIKNLHNIILVDYDCDDVFQDGIVFTQDSTSCYGVISDKAYGTIKYDIAYKTTMNKIVRVDPIVEVEPPSKAN